MLCPLTELSLDSPVFVALAGEGLTIKCHVTIPAKTPKDKMTCFNPHNTEIYSCDIQATTEMAENVSLNLDFTHLNCSGEYHCKYRKSKVYWFVLVRGG